MNIGQTEQAGQMDSLDLVFNTFQADDLMEKLKLLNYELELQNELNMKPLTKFYFVKSFNPGEQYYVFALLCAWLIRKLGKRFVLPQEMDDPNQTALEIISTYEEMDKKIDCSTSKIMQGAGEMCLRILDRFSTRAINIAKTVLSRPYVAVGEESVADYIDNDAELVLEKVEDDQEGLTSDESEGESNLFFDVSCNRLQVKEYFKGTQENTASLNEIENWRMELEEVIPQLRVIVKQNSRDWRAHVATVTKLNDNLSWSTNDTHAQLKQLQTDISFEMDKVYSRERHLNVGSQNLVEQLQNVSVEYSNIQLQKTDFEKKNYNTENELGVITNENENIKIQMEHRGNSMTDGSPVINIKNAVNKLREETSQIYLEICMFQRVLDQDILRQAAQFTELEIMPISYNN